MLILRGRECWIKGLGKETFVPCIGSTMESPDKNYLLSVNKIDMNLETTGIGDLITAGFSTV
jgi:hypothetical protein